MQTVLISLLHYIENNLIQKSKHLYFLYLKIDVNTLVTCVLSLICSRVKIILLDIIFYTVINVENKFYKFY